MSFLEVSNLTAGYGGKAVIEDISFAVSDCELVGILGANGSGKTTLLKAICGILPHSGKCTLNGICIENLKDREIAKLLGYIPQRSGITIDISIADVVLMGFNPRLRLLEQPSTEMRESAYRAIETVGLQGKENENYMSLSEGQKQLCILARTLVMESSLLLLDEPESALDFGHRYNLMKIIKDFLREKERGALVTLHDPQLALNFCDRLLLLENGKIISNISHKTEAVSKSEEALSRIYGAVSLQRCKGKDGREHFVMLREEI